MRPPAFPARRRLLLAAACLPLTGALAALGQTGPTLRPTANENLMEEHGLNDRILVIYARAIQLMLARQSFDTECISAPARTMMTVIHDHHEVDEEELVFPVLEKVGYGEVISHLQQEHRAGRSMTASILNSARSGVAGRRRQVRELASLMGDFIIMYTPHGGIEDSELFPAFRNAVGLERYAELARLFDARERKIGGRAAFNRHVAQITDIEYELGIGMALYARRPPIPSGSPRG